jgi:hypothetical protein
MKKLTKAEVFLADAIDDDEAFEAVLAEDRGDEAAWQRVAARVGALAEGHLPANSPFPRELLRAQTLRRVAGAAVIGRARALEDVTLLVPPDDPRWSVAIASELTDAYLYLYVRRAWLGEPPAKTALRVTFRFTVDGLAELRVLDLLDDDEHQVVVPATFAVVDPTVDVEETLPP